MLFLFFIRTGLPDGPQDRVISNVEKSARADLADGEIPKGYATIRWILTPAAQPQDDSVITDDRPLASPSGRGAERSEAERALSVSFADSSPKGRAKGIERPLLHCKVVLATTTEVFNFKHTPHIMDMKLITIIWTLKISVHFQEKRNKTGKFPS